MARNPTGKLGLLLTCCIAAQPLAVGRAAALTKIIIVPTARTMGAHRFAVDLTEKDPLFEAAERSLDLTLKAGLGDRVQVEMKTPLKSARSGGVLFSGKYTFATAGRGRSAAAVGVENVGSGNAATPYLALSHRLQSVDFTVGVASGAQSVARYFAGAEWLAGEKLHLLADYNTGNRTYASAGFQYDISRLWSLKSGAEAQHNHGLSATVKISYTTNY